MLVTMVIHVHAKLTTDCLLFHVLVIIKLTTNPVPLRFGCCSGKLKFCRYFNMFCDI